MQGALLDSLSLRMLFIQESSLSQHTDRKQEKGFETEQLFSFDGTLLFRLSLPLSLL